MPPTKRLPFPSRRSFGGGPVSPAGSVDPSLVGLVLRGLAPGHVVSIDGDVVSPDADGFVAVPPARRGSVQLAPATALEISDGASTRVAFVRLQVSPPRELDVESVPVVYVIGDRQPETGLPARVELVGFAEGSRILVNGARPSSATRDPATGIYSVAVPPGESSVYVEQPAGAAGMSGPGESRQTLGSGDVLDLTPDNFTVVPRRGSAPAPVRIDDGSGSVPDGALPVSPVRPTTAPASTAPASTAPASTAPASTAPASTAPASTAPLMAPPGFVEVTVNVPGASVTVGGVPLPGPPFRRELPAGDYPISVSANGYKPSRGTLTVASGFVTPVSVELEREPAPLSTAAKVGIAAATIAAIAVAVAALMPSKADPAAGSDASRKSQRGRR